MVSRICPHLVWCQEFPNYLTFPLQNFFQLRVPTLHLLLEAVMDSPPPTPLFFFVFFFTFFIFPKSPRSIISNGSVLESFGALYRKFWVVEVDWFIGVPASEYTRFYGFCTIYPISVAFPDSPDSVSFKLRCHQKDHDTYSLSLSTFLVQFLILD